MADKDDDLLERVTAMADELELTGQEKRRYIHNHMTRKGYRAVPQYVKADDDDDDDKDSFFSGRRRRKSGDDDGRRRGRSRDDDGDDDWYH